MDRQLNRLVRLDRAHKYLGFVFVLLAVVEVPLSILSLARARSAPYLTYVFCGILVAFFICIILWAYSDVAYSHFYARLFIRPVLAENIHDLDYHHGRGIKRREMNRLGLIYLHNINSSKDYFSGTYRHMRVQGAHVRIHEGGMIGGAANMTIKLAGTWLIVELPSHVQGNVQIFQEGFPCRKEVRRKPYSTAGFFVRTDGEAEIPSFLTHRLLMRLDEAAESPILISVAGGRLHLVMGTKSGVATFRQPEYRYMKINPDKAKWNAERDFRYIADVLDVLEEELPHIPAD